MSRLRVAAFVAGGPIAEAALAELAATHDLAVIVRARPRGPAWRLAASRLARRLSLAGGDPIGSWAAAAGVPVMVLAPGDEAGAATRLRAFAPDVGCIATFPRRIPGALREAAGRACLNLHTSLLPRHRGANPLFWTYHAGDAAGGVSVHLATEALDAGPVLLQEPVPIARGESVVEVHRRCASAGAALLARAVSLVGEGHAEAREQDESAATLAPSPRPGHAYAELGTWSCAQAWHFLAGMRPRYRDPLIDDRGKPVFYARVTGFEVRAPLVPPGTVVHQGAGWEAWTPDGVVHLAGEGAGGT